MKDAVIIGGGIAGLATAFYLERRSREKGVPIELLIVEKEGRIGGKIVTREEDGFVVEGGPDSFINQKPHGLQLCRDLNIMEDLLPSNDSTYRTRLLQKGRLLPYPDGFRLAVPTKIWPFIKSPLLSPFGKIRMGFDLLLPPRKSQNDESLSRFIQRRIGREALEKIAGPIMSGIFVSDPDRMSVQSTFPMFVELERRYGSLTRGIIKARKAMANHSGKDTPSSSVFTSLQRGMGSLVKALSARLGPVIRTECMVSGIQRTPAGWRVKTDSLRRGVELIDAKHIVLAIPAFEAAVLLESVEPGLASTLRSIRSVSSAVVNLAYPDSALTACPGGGGFGFVVPRAESSRILALTWSCRKFNGRSPLGHQLIRVFIGGSRHEETALLPEADILTVVREELARTLGITAVPERTWTWTWPSGNPQFDVGHLDRVHEMERMAGSLPGLHLAGSAYRGLGIPDCTRSGMAAADAILGQGTGVRSGARP